MDVEVIAKILAPSVTAIVAFILKRYLEGKPKLITYLIHTAAVPLRDENETTINTHSIVVRNAGKRTAHNIRVGHSILPPHQIYPQISHEIVEGADSSAEIVIPTLVPNEQINISYVYFPPLIWNQVNSYCKSDEMFAKVLNVIPAPQLSRPQLIAIWGLMFVGGSTLVYWGMRWIWAWAQ
ncbi:hypothetical protein ACTXGQ_15200 [Marinobacter sp. 1Y8]